MILADAGPLVALIRAGDRHHHACREALASFREPLLTVWPAFAEAMYLLGFSCEAQDALWQILQSEALWMADLVDEDYARMRQLMRKYRDLPMDLADAALVRVAEREEIHRVFTLDRRDFEIYRPHRIRRFEIVP